MTTGEGYIMEEMSVKATEEGDIIEEISVDNSKLVLVTPDNEETTSSLN